MDVLAMNLKLTDGLSPVLEPSYPTDLVCFNSGVFYFFLEKQLAESERYGQYSAFLLFRFDKWIGSQNGNVGEEFIKCLSTNIRETDYLGLVAPDTVGVILKNANVGNTRKVTERLKDELKLSLSKGGEEKPGFDTSFAVYPTEAVTFGELRALVEARLNGDAH